MSLAFWSSISSRKPMIQRVKPMRTPTANSTGTNSQPDKRKAYGNTTLPPPTKTFSIVTTVPQKDTPRVFAEATSTSKGSVMDGAVCDMLSLLSLLSLAAWSLCVLGPLSLKPTCIQKSCLGQHHRVPSQTALNQIESSLAKTWRCGRPRSRRLSLPTVLTSWSAYHSSFCMHIFVQSNYNFANMIAQLCFCLRIVLQKRKDILEVFGELWACVCECEGPTKCPILQEQLKPQNFGKVVPLGPLCCFGSTSPAIRLEFDCNRATSQISWMQNTRTSKKDCLPRSLWVRRGVSGFLLCKGQGIESCFKAQILSALCYHIWQ